MTIHEMGPLLPQHGPPAWEIYSSSLLRRVIRNQPLATFSSLTLHQMNASLRLLLPLRSKPSVMDSVKNAANAVGEKVKETTASVSKEGNKAVA